MGMPANEAGNPPRTAERAVGLQVCHHDLCGRLIDLRYTAVEVELRRATFLIFEIARASFERGRVDARAHVERRCPGRIIVHMLAIRGPYIAVAVTAVRRARTWVSAPWAAIGDEKHMVTVAREGGRVFGHCCIDGGPAGLQDVKVHRRSPGSAR